MELVKQVFAFIIGALPFVVSSITFILKFVKNKKAKIALQNTLKMAEQLQAFIVKAESFINYSGSEKKEYVMTQAMKFALEHNVPFESEKISEMIEEIIATTKKVNSRSKDLYRQKIKMQGEN